MNPILLTCPLCFARPGEYCKNLFSGESREDFHANRNEKEKAFQDSVREIEVGLLERLFEVESRD